MRAGLFLLSVSLLLSGCAAVRSAPSLPQDLSVVRDQLVVYSDFNLPKRHRLVEELVALRSDIASRLDVPVSDEPIHVYLFDEPKTYQGYIAKHYPDLPDRRAFFVESDTRLTVYAHWGDRVAEDLRHEVTHGYLHAVIPNLPLWLDEGLAEYFEVARGWDGLNTAHVQQLATASQNGKWQPDLARLDRLASIEAMEQRDYAEAWLWIHFLIETNRERGLLLQHHLAVLRDKAQAPPLSLALKNAEPQAESALLDHLRMLAAANRVE